MLSREGEITVNSRVKKKQKTKQQISHCYSSGKTQARPANQSKRFSSSFGTIFFLWVEFHRTLILHKFFPA